MQISIQEFYIKTMVVWHSHVFDVVGLDVGRVRARLEPLGVDVHEEVPRDVHEVEVVGVLGRDSIESKLA